MIPFHKQNLEGIVNAILDNAFNNNPNIQEIKYLSGSYSEVFSNDYDKTFLLFRMSGTQKIQIETLLCDEEGDDFILFKIVNGNHEEVNQYQYFTLDQTSNFEHFSSLFQSELEEILP